MDINKMIARVKAILLTPKTEWPVIAAEPATIQGLYTGYILILAALPPIALLIGTLGFFGFGLKLAIKWYVSGLVSVFLFSLVIDALAPTFNGQKNQIQALKLVAYSMTAAWVAGVALIVPLLGALVARQRRTRRRR